VRRRYSGAVFDPERLDVYFDEVQVVRRGIEVVGTIENRAAAGRAKPAFAVTRHLHRRRGDRARASHPTCPSIRAIHSDYRT